MRFLLLIAGIILFAGTASAAVPLEQIPSPTYPTVTLRVQWNVGSMDDPAGKEGLAYLMAESMIEGGTRDLTYREVQDRLFPMAASIRVLVDKETSTFIGEVHRDHLKDFYKIFKALITEPRLDPKDIDRVKQQIMAYIEKSLRSADDEQLGKEVLSSTLYKGHPYGHLTMGNLTDLATITADDIRSFHDTAFTRNNVTLGIAGGYPSSFITTFSRDFSRLPDTRMDRSPLPDPPALEGRHVVLVQKETSGAAISIGFPISITRGHQDFIPLMVANSYLGEHRTFNGVLMNHMRGDRGLNYGDYSYIEYFDQDGGTTFSLPNIARRQQFFSIWIRPVDPRNALFSIRQSLFETDRLIREGISEEEFEAARKFVRNYSKLWVQSLSRRLGYLMDSRFYGTGDFIREIDTRLETLTRDEVNDAIRTYLQTENLVIAVVAKDAETMKTLLEKEIASPIMYQTEGTKCDLLKEDKVIESYPLNVTSVTITPVDTLFQ
ncbi:MAG TPA: pitrilysin family protein [Thermoanaerobaculia bacterium]|nr:pitrilysin family protein [Thermoanaerobaculia bacterium]HUM31227.1 pitrilysin family protein [Thermoanaerobaculia bacterium]HXK69581.1 pitrilysin family protein [Thermoanaerobaculia bacterium]